MREASYEICVIECGGRCCRSRKTVAWVDNAQMRYCKALGGFKFFAVRPNLWQIEFAYMGGCKHQAPSGACQIHDRRPLFCRSYPARPEPDCLLCAPEVSRGD